MIWGILGLFLVIVLVVVALLGNQANRAIPIAIIAVVGIIAFFAWYQDQQFKAAQQRINKDEVELADVELLEEERGRWVTGRVRNHSRDHTLHALTVRVQIEDCLKQACEIVAESDIQFTPDVPPGQARDFQERVFFQSLVRPRGRRAVRYEVLATEAK
ncbi:MAG TPA: hypothetical protein ENJ19_00665 [Gammaproteobacteria bacterium]|nr:hypothetical protein [Gammaproteobacteria bacterium]